MEDVADSLYPGTSLFRLVLGLKRVIVSQIDDLPNFPATASASATWSDHQTRDPTKLRISFWKKIVTKWSAASSMSAAWSSRLPGQVTENQKAPL